MVEQHAIQAAKEYLQGAGPWKLDEIGIGADDYLVKCFVKAIIAAEARGKEAAAKIAEHAWLVCAIDVIMDAEAAQQLCERTAAAIRAALNGGQHD